MTKDQYCELLARYFQGGYFSTPDAILSMMIPGYVYNKNAKGINAISTDEFQSDASLKSIHIEIPVYSDNNPNVVSMISFLEPLAEDLAGAILHGSLATGEEIPYSDFDGLLILKDSILHNKTRLVQLAQRVRDSRKIMMLQDPLQHHGWFVLPESFLKNYPQTYLPYQVLQQSKSLLKKSFSIQLGLQDNYEFNSPLRKICASIRKKTSDDNFPDSIYGIKNLMSEFMLLPVRYLQARDQKGVLKKESFELARQDFQKEDWHVMDEISDLRSRWKTEWTQDYPLPTGKLNYFWLLKMKRKKTAIPEEIKRLFTSEFIGRMSALNMKIEKRIIPVEKIQS